MSYEGRISKQSQEHPSGWAPDSETPPWGWPLTILGTIAVIAIFIGLFGFVGSAVFL